MYTYMCMRLCVLLLPSRSISDVVVSPIGKLFPNHRAKTVRVAPTPPPGPRTDQGPTAAVALTVPAALPLPSPKPPPPH